MHNQWEKGGLAVSRWSGDGLIHIQNVIKDSLTSLTNYQLPYGTGILW